ncbi:MAG: tRNA-dihydrouridine synthase family protein [Nanoarchaeota archaeon]|nr:MAG: tRNA-dihydrouridine synthase family protein [Nanoarchaeota archaeon]
MAFILMAAPLEDVSDAAFRSICHKFGADLTFTEMTHVTSLARNNKSAWRRLQFPDSTPCQIQLLPAREDELEKFLTEFSPFDGFSGINFNLGCPSPNVTHAGLGCAMVKRVNKVEKMISIVRKYGYPVSIKMRLGLNKYEKERKAYLNLIKGTSPDFFVVHARHGKQTYGEPADFSVFEECAKIGKKIIANGDIKTKAQIDLLSKLGISGAMIGRAAVKDPGIFNRLRGMGAPPPSKLRELYIQTSRNFGISENYAKNVLKRIGKNSEQMDKNLLI